MGELVNAPRGLTPDRALAALALDTSGWSHEGALSVVQDEASIEQALQRLEDMAVPAKLVEPGGRVDGKRGPRTHKLIQSIAVIGAKISPTMAQEQSLAWIAALTTALSDIPFTFAQKGAEEAVHVPLKFLNEVEGVIREKAERARLRHGTAVRRLLNMQREMRRPSTPQIEAPAKPMTDEQLQAMPEPLKKIGLGAGWLREIDGKIEFVEENTNDR